MSPERDGKKVPKDGNPCCVDTFIGKIFVVKCIHLSRPCSMDTFCLFNDRLKTDTIRHTRINWNSRIFSTETWKNRGKNALFLS